MLAARIHRWRGDPVLEQVGEPQAEPEHSVVEIAAAAVSHLDLTVASGEFALHPSLPYVPGAEGAGRVLSSARFAPGTTVRIRGAGVGVKRDGLWAERALVPDESLTAVDAEGPPAVLATYFSPCATAYSALNDVAELRSGERVVVTGAAGAVGALTAQLALRSGAEVIGLEAGEARVGRIPAGVRAVDVAADEAIAQVCADGPVDLLVDFVGGELLPQLVTGAIRAGGRAVLVGYVGGTHVTFDLPNLIDADVRLLPMNLMHRGAGLEHAAAELLDLLRTGDLSLPLVSVPLAEIPDALDRLRRGTVEGRVVVIPGGSIERTDIT